MKTIRYILFVTAFMLASNVYAQDISTYKSQKNDIKIGLFYSNDLNFSSDDITFTQESGFHNDYNQFNFTTGLTFDYYFSSNFSLGSGASYANRDFSGLYYCNVCSFQPLGPQKEEINLQFVQVPVTIRYYPYNKKIGLFGELGILNQLAINKSTSYQLNGNTYSLSGIAGAGIAYNISHTYSVQLITKYTKALSNIFRNADYDYRVLSFQLSLTKRL